MADSLTQLTVSASTSASEADKLRAWNAKRKLGNQTDWERAFVYNAVLNLLYRGVALTEKNILEESRKLGRHEKARYEKATGKVTHV